MPKVYISHCGFYMKSQQSLYNTWDFLKWMLLFSRMSFFHVGGHSAVSKDATSS